MQPSPLKDGGLAVGGSSPTLVGKLGGTDVTNGPLGSADSEIRNGSLEIRS